MKANPAVTSGLGGTPLQAVPCDICGASKQQTWLTLRDMMSSTSRQIYRLARCRSCDLIYLNPRPYRWDLHRYYPDSYAPFTRSRLGELARNWLHRRSVQELSTHFQYPKRVLDIGCGTGELLDQVRQSGNAHITGVEPSPRAARIARDDRNLDVRTGTLEQVRFPDESFDTVLLSHVLEHLPSPTMTLLEVQRILKPGGIVIIWVPNARSWAATWLGRYWMGWDVPRHLYAFSPSTLHRLLGKTALSPEQIVHEKHAIEWSWGLRLWASDRFDNPTVDRVLGTLHPAQSLALTPVSLVAAWFQRSGRIRLIARKR